MSPNGERPRRGIDARGIDAMEMADAPRHQWRPAAAAAAGIEARRARGAPHRETPRNIPANIRVISSSETPLWSKRCHSAPKSRTVARSIFSRLLVVSGHYRRDARCLPPATRSPSSSRFITAARRSGARSPARCGKAAHRPRLSSWTMPRATVRRRRSQHSATRASGCCATSAIAAPRRRATPALPPPRATGSRCSTAMTSGIRRSWRANSTRCCRPPMRRRPA